MFLYNDLPNSFLDRYNSNFRVTTYKKRAYQSFPITIGRLGNLSHRAQRDSQACKDW